MTLAIVAITPGGADLARRLGECLPEAEVHLPERFRRDDRCRYFDGPAASALPRLFARCEGLVCIMATGIVVRVLAPHLKGKEQDPAVVVCDEAGRHAISLLSGHLGGANELARQVAAACGAQAVITTATDVNGLPAWDEVARVEGLPLEPLRAIRRLNSLLLEGGRIALIDPRGRIAPRYAEVSSVRCAASLADAQQAGAEGTVWVTNQSVSDLKERDNLLLLHPKNLVVGIGCNRGTPAAEIEAAVMETLAEASLSPLSLTAVATIVEKADEAGISAFARGFNLPLEYHAAEALNGVNAPSAPSAHALAAVGAKGVCEPAALLSAGGGPLLVGKQKRGNVTVAVAEKLLDA